jgi:riboflavin synthase
MFTGIVRERARVASFANRRLVVESTLESKQGDSVSVDGICLTVVDCRCGRLAFDVMLETAARGKPFGAEVNLR